MICREVRSARRDTSRLGCIGGALLQACTTASPDTGSTGAAADSGDGPSSTSAVDGGATTAGADSSGTAGSSSGGGAAPCHFPTFERASTWLRTTDEGNCDAAAAARFGGDCENFHWLGLMGDPFVLHDEGGYRMWYSAGRRVGDSNWTVGIAAATSADGMLWNDQKDLTQDVVPVIEGGTVGLDEFGTETNAVVRAPDGSYRMYYTGDRGNTPSSVHVIGMASSDDGVAWTKRETPVLTATLPWEQAFDAGGFEVGGVLEPSVIIEDGVWRLWYQAFGHEADEIAFARFGYAESSDGITWEKHPEPIFRGEGAMFDAVGVGHTNVVADPAGGYHLFYVGIGLDEFLRMGHAWSEDGLDWEPNPNNPIIVGAAGEWDEGLVGGPSAVFVDGVLRLYYMGTPAPDFLQTVHFAMSEGRCLGD